MEKINNTNCSGCGRSLANNGKKYLPCKCNRFTPNKDFERRDKMIEQEQVEKQAKPEKEKKISVSSQIRDLLNQNKTVDEIMKQLGCKRKQVLDTRWGLAHPKK